MNNKMKPLKLHIDKFMYIGCIPVDACPEHPTDQSPCIQIVCPHCACLMWFSEKKRKIKEYNPAKVKVYCLRCLAVASEKEDLEPMLFDIGRVI